MNTGYEALVSSPGNTSHQRHIPDYLLRRGSLKGKKAVVIDKDTTVYVSENKTPEQVERIRKRYFEHLHGRGGDS